MIRALAESTEFYRAMLDTVTEGIYLVDRDRRIVYWNAAAERISGYTRDEVLGHSCSDNFLMHCDGAGCQRCGDECPLKETIQDGVSRRIQLILRHKNGSRVPVEVRVSPAHGKDGETVGALEVFADANSGAAAIEEARELKDVAYYVDALTGFMQPAFDPGAIDKSGVTLGGGEKINGTDNDRDRCQFQSSNRAWGHETAQDLEALLVLNAGMARGLVGADRCSVWLVDTKNRRLWTKATQGSQKLHVPIGKGLVGACVAGNEAILVNDTSQDERFLRNVEIETGYVTKSSLTMPLHGAGGKPMGALQVLNKPGGFSPEDVDLLGLCGTYTASTLETHRLRKEAQAGRLLLQEVEIARDVQQHLLPQTPSPIPGLDYAGYCRSAELVGGDYYDFLPIPDLGLFFTIGDVSGKGIAAAVLMASIQASLRSQVAKAPASLAGLIRDLNKVVYSFSAPDKYSTLFCGLLDIGTRKLTYVNAGQVCPMLLRSSDCQVERLETGGYPVGMLGTSEYDQGEVLLQPGDAVVCFSDGISEAKGPNEEMWNEFEVERMVRTFRRMTAQQMINLLVEAADRFTGEAEQADDMTVVAIRV